MIENFRPGRRRPARHRLRGRQGGAARTSSTARSAASARPVRTGSVPGFDIMAQGMVGFLRMTGEPGGRPAKVGIAINDIAAGATADLLDHGRADAPPAPPVRASTWTSPWSTPAWRGRSGSRAPTSAPARCPSRPAPGTAAPPPTRPTGPATATSRSAPTTTGCGRGWSTTSWSGPSGPTDPRFVTLPDRMANIESSRREIEAITTTRTTDEWIETLDKAGVPGGPVLTYDETLADPHVVARDMIVELEHPVDRPDETIGPPTKFSGLDYSVRGPAPWLGQHTAEVLREAGVDDDEITTPVRRRRRLRRPPRPARPSPRRPLRRKRPDMSDHLVVERHDAIATVVPQPAGEPQRHHVEMYGDLPDLVRDLDADPSVKVVVIRGAGQKSFASGADISEFEAERSDAMKARAYNEHVAAAEHAHRGAHQAHDRDDPRLLHRRRLRARARVRHAVRRRQRASSPSRPRKLGLVYSLESTKRLVDLVGPGPGQVGPHVGPADRRPTRAYELGLFDEVVATEELEDADLRLRRAARAAAPSSASAPAKSMVDEDRGRPGRATTSDHGAPQLVVRHRGLRRGRPRLPGEALAELHLVLT